MSRCHPPCILFLSQASRGLSKQVGFVDTDLRGFNNWDPVSNPSIYQSRVLHWRSLKKVWHLDFWLLPSRRIFSCLRFEDSHTLVKANRSFSRSRWSEASFFWCIVEECLGPYQMHMNVCSASISLSQVQLQLIRARVCWSARRLWGWDLWGEIAIAIAIYATRCVVCKRRTW